MNRWARELTAALILPFVGTGCMAGLKHMSSSPQVYLNESIPAGYEKVKLDEALDRSTSITKFKPEYSGKKICFEFTPTGYSVRDVVSTAGNNTEYSLTIKNNDSRFYLNFWKASHPVDIVALLKAKRAEADESPVVVGGYVEKYRSFYRFYTDFIVIEGNKIEF